MTNLTDACLGCPGRCCTRRFWNLVHLTKEESRNPIFKGKLTLSADGGIALSLGRTACHFLDRKTGHCRIYEDRPMACRGYVCHQGDDHSTAVIHRFPALKRHLKRQGLLPELKPEDSFFYVEKAGAASAWHLRGLRGHKNVKVGYYSYRRGTYEIIGRFDRSGKFHRNTNDQTHRLRRRARHS